MSLPPLPFHLVNAFAPSPHTGSQAAIIVFPLDDPRFKDDKYLTALASDFGLPATVFVAPSFEGEMAGGDVPCFVIRWFTDTGELPLCGHGTLTAAQVLFSALPVPKITFRNTICGTLSASLVSPDPAERVSEIAIDMPISPTTSAIGDERGELERAVLAGTVGRVGGGGLRARDIIDIATYDYGGRSAVVQVKDTVDLASLAVDPKRLGLVFTITIITQLVGLEGGVVRVDSRVFGAPIGLDEDTATGSAHSVLTGYYLSGPGSASVRALGVDPGTATLSARQLSKRGGAMRCSLAEGGARAQLVGTAVRVGGGLLEVYDEGQDV